MDERPLGTQQFRALAGARHLQHFFHCRHKVTSLSLFLLVDDEPINKNAVEFVYSVSLKMKNPKKRIL